MNDLTWIEKNRSFLNIKKIEEEAKMPDKTIDHVLAGRRNFPKKWEKPLNAVIKKIKNPA